MTLKHARAIYALTALPEWKILNEFWQDEIEKLHISLETCSDLGAMMVIQGEIIKLRDNIKLRSVAQDVLSSEI